jgi:hypothetical protein
MTTLKPFNYILLEGGLFFLTGSFDLAGCSLFSWPSLQAFSEG